MPKKDFMMLRIREFPEKSPLIFSLLYNSLVCPKHVFEIMSSHLFIEQNSVFELFHQPKLL